MLPADMNDRAAINEYLDRFGIDHQKTHEGFLVKHPLGLRTSIVVHEDQGRITFRDHLQGWNVLSGAIRFKNLHGAVRYQWISVGVLMVIGFIFIGIVQGYMEGTGRTNEHYLVAAIVLAVLILQSFISLSAITYYTTRAEAFKNGLQTWLATRENRNTPSVYTTNA